MAGMRPGEQGWAPDCAAHCRDLLEVAGAEFVPHYLGDGQDKLMHKIQKEHVTAYWSITDHEATQIVNRCYEQGIKIPEHVSIVGRNDTPWAVDCRPQPDDRSR